MYSHPTYRNGHFSNSRYNHHHEYSQFNGGSRRLPMNNSGSYAPSRRYHSNNNHGQHNHPRTVPEVAREMGLILEVHRNFGRIISQTNFTAPNIHIFFSLLTLVNGSPLNSITDNLADIFQVGTIVEIEIEGSVDSRELRDNAHIILTCSSIRPTAEIGHEPELVPMIVIQDACDVPLALIANHDLVAIPRQIFTVREIPSAYLSGRTEVTTVIEWPEYASIGRSVEGRVIIAPPWMQECTNPSVKKVAVSLQRFGQDREGFATVKEYIGQGVILTPIDPEDQRICGDLFFPYEMRTSWSHTECQNVYRVGTKWYFRACLELPKRRHKYRVYRLDSLEDAAAVNDTVERQAQTQQLPANETVDNVELLPVADVQVNTLGSITGPSVGEQACLIDLSDESAQTSFIPHATKTNRSTAAAEVVTSNTLTLLEAVNFDAIPLSAAVNSVDETRLLQTSPLASGTSTTNFDDSNAMENITNEVRQFHILDENFSITSLNFDAVNMRKSTYESEMCGCSDNENDEPRETVTETTNLQTGAATLNYFSNEILFNDTTEEPEVPSVSSVKRDQAMKSPDRFSAAHQRIDSDLFSSFNDQRQDSSNDGSDDEMFHAVRVKRGNDSSEWWFTRKLPYKTPENGDTNSLVQPSCSSTENVDLVEATSASKKCESVSVVTDNETGTGESVSDSSPGHSLTGTLQSDNVYSKFFSELIKK